MKHLIFAEEVYAIAGAAIEVHKKLGPGFLEAVYQEALEIEFGLRGIPFASQKNLTVRYKGVVLRKEYSADFVCYGKIIVELKALSKLSGTDEAQLLNYLRATGLEVGVLINFGSSPRLDWKRFVLSQKSASA
ncbi:MAG: GxxExxY protein [Deltaproteobacteria bacterium]|nr:GxxExxY protein [Deltaproteobacteria bacterium]